VQSTISTSPCGSGGIVNSCRLYSEMDDDMYCDADQAGGVFSFENIGRMEAAKTASALLQIEYLLLKPYNQSPLSGENSASSALVVEEEMPFEHYRRIESEGYDAHSERVDMKEVLSWQSAFPYFAAKGEQVCSIHEPAVPLGLLGDFFPTLTNNFAQQYSAGSIIDGRTCTGINDLVVDGRKCNIPSIDNDSHEVNIADGILEELIAVHVSPGDDPSVANESEDNVENVPSPRFNRQQEIVSLLLDALWPEVIEVCKPLVQKIVEVSRRENVTYDKEKTIAEGENDDNSEGGYASW
jgi:hypothetical protein